MSTATAADLWKDVTQHLQQLLHPDVFSRWIAVIDAVSLQDGALTLAVDNDFYQTWLEENYLAIIRQAIACVSESELEVKFEIKRTDANPLPAVLPDAETPAAEPAPVRQTKAPARDRGSKRVEAECPLNPKFTFNHFIVGSSNSFAHAAAQAVAQAPARAYNPLFIYGGTGMGKTHVMQAIGHHVLSTSRARICYITTEAFLNEYIHALQTHSLPQFRKKYRNTDLLLIDDIHFLASKERIQEEFFHTFNVLFDAHKQIVMTSDRPASEISGLEKRLVSRFEWGLVTELEPPDLETRIAILREKQENARYKLSDPLLLFIAENVRANIRRLEGALIRAVSYASLTGRELTLESLRYLLRDTLEQEQQSQVSLAEIQRAVAEHFDLRLTDMTSKCRERAVATPRQVAMYLCRRMTPSSLPHIAESFGKTHGTILHAYRTIDTRMDVDNDLRKSVQAISRKLGKPI